MFVETTHALSLPSGHITKPSDPANNFIYSCLVRNNNSIGKIVLTKTVLTILFSFPKALPLGWGMLPLRGVNSAGIMNRINNMICFPYYWHFPNLKYDHHPCTINRPKV